jgi:hypothetical protein
MKIKYALRGSGWAEVKFAGCSEIGIGFSYLHDSLLDLVRAAISLKEGVQSATALFMAEPGEHLAVLTRGEQSTLNVEVRWFADWASQGLCPSEKYKTVYRDMTTVEEFVSEVLNSMEVLLKLWDLHGYKKQWAEHDFPYKEYRALAAR